MPLQPLAMLMLTKVSAASRAVGCLARLQTVLSAGRHSAMQQTSTWRLHGGQAGSIKFNSLAACIAAVQHAAFACYECMHACMHACANIWQEAT